MVIASSQVSVLLPIGGNCPHRARAREYVRAWYEHHHPEYELVYGIIRGTSVWCKAEAVAYAAHRASGDVLVVADADTVAPRLADAVQALTKGWNWAMPHYTVNRLNRRTTDAVLLGSDPESFPRSLKWYDQLPYVGIPGGGIVVLRRETYESAPIDPGFRGWGQEDEAWALALRSLHGKPWRPSRSAPLWHLWHPPQKRKSRAIGSDKSKFLLSEYQKSRTPEMMSYRLSGAREFYWRNVREEVLQSN